MTEEQLKTAIEAFTEMYEAGNKIYGLLKELGWEDIQDDPESFPFETEFDREAHDFLDALRCPGHDILSCDEIAARFYRELKQREKLRKAEANE